eukprot:16463-Eustigmatos_ZCMA.PRE.1
MSRVVPKPSGLVCHVGGLGGVRMHPQRHLNIYFDTYGPRGPRTSPRSTDEWHEDGGCFLDAKG